jgi:RimJ/RimL family protein N-acetyltransferase
MTMPALLDSWPLFGLRLRCRRAELRLIREADLDDLIRLLPADVEHDPRAGQFPGQDRDGYRRTWLLQSYWRSLGTWSPSAWFLDLLVSADGEPVGIQTLEAAQFGVLGTVDTASWLVPAARGRGLGVAMRMAVLGFAFDHLGAAAAISSAVPANDASLGVSRRIGYQPNGTSFSDSEDGRIELSHLRLTADQWRASGLGAEVMVHGAEPARPWFGLP